VVVLLLLFTSDQPSKCTISLTQFGAKQPSGAKAFTSRREVVKAIVAGIPSGIHLLTDD
jgi:hypothetical protein